MLQKKTAHVTVRSVVLCVQIILLGLRDSWKSRLPCWTTTGTLVPKTMRSLHMVIKSGVFRIP